MRGELINLFPVRNPNGSWVKLKILEAGIKQTALEALVGTSSNNISMMIRPDSPGPSFEEETGQILFRAILEEEAAKWTYLHGKSHRPRDRDRRVLDAATTLSLWKTQNAKHQNLRFTTFMNMLDHKTYEQMVTQYLEPIYGPVISDGQPKIKAKLVGDPIVLKRTPIGHQFAKGKRHLRGAKISLLVAAEREGWLDELLDAEFREILKEGTQQDALVFLAKQAGHREDLRIGSIPCL